MVQGPARSLPSRVVQPRDRFVINAPAEIDPGMVIRARPDLDAEMVFNPDTGLSAQFAGGPVDEARRAKFLATIPLGRFSTALDVANAALYLASDEAAFISGVCIEVDGARCV